MAWVNANASFVFRAGAAIHAMRPLVALQSLERACIKERGRACATVDDALTLRAADDKSDGVASLDHTPRACSAPTTASTFTGSGYCVIVERADERSFTARARYIGFAEYAPDEWSIGVDGPPQHDVISPVIERPALPYFAGGLALCAAAIALVITAVRRRAP